VTRHRADFPLRFPVFPGTGKRSGNPQVNRKTIVSKVDLIDFPISRCFYMYKTPRVVSYS
jgi:hypothetical protein